MHEIKQPQKQKPNYKKEMNLLKEYNNIQELVKQTSSKKVYEINNNIKLPNINFNEFKADNFFERFGDLGEYGIKRSRKIN